MNNRRLWSEKGQSLVIVALGLVAFIAMLALVLDGGNAYAAKRQAQNAADAGALAGASFMCKWKDRVGGEAKARDYAVINNGAFSAIAVGNMNDATMNVTATVQKDTFFAGIIGFPQVSAKAEAIAQCKPPAAMGVLPVAWSCRENVIAGEGLPGIDCAQVFGPCTGLSCIYVVMDSVKVAPKNNKCKVFDENNPDCYELKDVVCDQLLDDNGNGIIDPEEYSIISAPPPDSEISVIDCDIDDDGINELKSGGDRSWLDLNGNDGSGGGAQELKNWLTGGYAPPIDIHTWLPSSSGGKTSAYLAVIKQCEDDSPDCIVGKDVILPVFDKYCNGTPTIYPLSYAQESRSYCEAGANDHMGLIDNGSRNYHVISFSKLHVTCIQAGKHAYGEPELELGKNDPCPGYNAAATKSDTNPNPSLDDNDKTIEGYFLSEQITGYAGSGNFVDAGAFVVVLVP